MKKILLTLLIISIACTGAEGQNKSGKKDTQVKNVIFMIGDGMGLAHVTAASATMNYAPLNLERAQYVGLQKNYSASDRVTDSAASGTALATGVKTYNGAIGVGTDKKPVENILEKARRKGLATGVVATYSVTNATPAAFVAHVEKRDMEELIAKHYLSSGIDIFMGGGLEFFNDRKDGKKLTEELEANGYTMIYDVAQIESAKGDKIGGLFAPNAMPRMREGRGDYLPTATRKALDILGKNSKKGFVVMIEGSMIDQGGHSNDIKMIVDETIDFDKAVKVAFDFADQNPGTLVVVTADHETGGLTLPAGKSEAVPSLGLKAAFSSGGHTGTFIPIYAYGPGAENFSGIMENTDIPKIMERLLSIE